MTRARGQGTARSEGPRRAPPGETWRRCIVSGVSRPKADLIRFVAGPDGVVVPDPEGRLPGRGIWLSPRRDMIQAACARKAFARAARAPLHAPADLADQVERLLARRCADLLGLARRAGQARGGFEKVAAAIKNGKAAVLVQAGDAAEDGRRRLRAAALARIPELPVVEVLSAQELTRVFGERAYVHVAIAPGELARRFVAEAGRLAAVRAAVDVAAGQAIAADAPAQG